MSVMVIPPKRPQHIVRTLAKRVVQIGSTSTIFAAVIKVWSFSAFKMSVAVRILSAPSMVPPCR